MEYTIDDTLVYVLHLTRRIRKDDVPAAILLLLADLGFQAHLDGFGYLRKIILLKFDNHDIRLSVAYRAVAEMYEDEVGSSQIDQAIRCSIETAWNLGDRSKWSYLFSKTTTGKSKRPSNNEFISQMAIVLELLYSCKEASYEVQ